jgi:integrase
MPGRAKHRHGLPKHVWFQPKRLADGTLVHYGFYGRGPGSERLGREGSAEFHERLAAVLRREPEDGRVEKLIWKYKTSKEFEKLRPRTQADYRKQLDKISARFGKLRIEAMRAPEMAEHIYNWRDKLAETSPRQADYAISVLAAMLAWSVKRGLITHNRAAGVGDVYTADRRQKTWSTDAQAAFLKAADEPMQRAFVLAVETGLSQEDLLVLPWTAVAEHVIVSKRLKNGTPVAIPVSPELAAVLKAIPRDRSLTVLTKADGLPWDPKGNGLRAAFREARIASSVDGLTFHDLRGTFITRRRTAGWTAEEVALCSGHKIAGEQGAQSAYADRATIALANALRLAERHYGAKREQNLQTDLQTAGDGKELSA